MTSPAPCRSPSRSRSQAGGRRPSTARPTALVSDCPPDTEDQETSPSLGPRSVSLNTLQPTIIQPRMAQLETLEAKMASIEVSLSSTPRRKKNGSISAMSLSSIRSMPKEFAAKELENLRNSLRDKENIIQSLKGQLTVPGLRLNGIRNGNNNSNNSINNNRELTEVEKKQAEDRLNRLKTDVDNKRLAIKNLKMALERLDITDNIDVRIQQAELEYQLGREELNLLTLLEETRALQLCIEESNRNSSEANTLYSCVDGNQYVILQALEVEYDPKSPKFGASQRDSIPGLWIDWALEDTGLNKGDRLIEVNGKIVLTKTRDDLMRLLAAAPDPAQMVILRKHAEDGTVSVLPKTTSKEVAALRSELDMVKERAEETQRVKDGLRSDNIRLTHRISYLEEQVSELLNRKSFDNDIRIITPSPVISKSNQNVTSINITNQNPPVANGSNEMQVFQKGPQVTALVANVPSLESKDSPVSLPVRSKSSMSNVSNTHIPAPSPQPDYCHRGHRSHKQRPSRNAVQSPTSQQNYERKENVSLRKHTHHHHHREKDYSSETNSTVDQSARYGRRNHEHRYSADFTRVNSEKDYGTSDVMDQSYKKATKIVHELTRSNKDGSLYEKHRQKCITASEKYNADILKHYNARKSTSVLDFRSEVHIGPRYSESRSTEELDAVETPNKLTNRLYKKIQDVRSVKSLDFDSDCNSTSTNHCSKNGYPTKNNMDYMSEPNENNKLYSAYHPGYSNESMGKPKPPPPKKPLRLSLHKTHSLQSVDSCNTNNDVHNGKSDSRKSLKRAHKTEKSGSNGMIIKPQENGELNLHKDSHQIKWSHYRRSVDNILEQGSWC